MFKRATQKHSRLLPISMALLAATPFLAQLSSAQSTPTAAPANAAPYMLKSWISALHSPFPYGSSPGTLGPVVLQSEFDLNGYGIFGSYQPGGAIITGSNAFFQPLGSNGRTCATCHQPSSAMSVSGADIVGRFIESNGADPMFAPVDGANCPSQVPAANTTRSYLGGQMGSGKSMAAAHSLLLTRGVFRIFLPMPANPEFTLKVMSDPNGCNTLPNYATVTDASGAVTQMISVYRRPLLATNLKFVTESAIAINFQTGQPLPTDPATGGLVNGNIMWDGREPTLETQASDATLGHAQALAAPSDAQVAEMVTFENAFFSAQQSDWFAGNLAANGALGGPINLSVNVGVAPGAGGPPGPGGPPPAPAFDLFNAYSTVTGTSLAALQQASIYRGQEIFNTRAFAIANLPGFNGVGGGGGPPGGGGGGPATGTCSLCHGLHNVGSDNIPFAQHNIGVTGDAPQFGGPQPAKDLPIFQLTCPAATPSPYGTTVVTTNDPGRALITGKCADIAQMTTPPLRGLASHAPYFHDGSAASLLAVVNFYNARLAIGYSAQDKIDLVNFLSSL